MGKYNSIEYIKSDIMRYYGDVSFVSFIKGYLKNNLIRWQVAFRLSNDPNFILKMIGNFLWIINRSKKRIQIPKKTKIGYGLLLSHNGYIVINKTAVIGNNCNLSHFVTIGSNHKKAATIGDNVYIGPNVCIVENVKIGNNVTIGAGSVVTKDIPNNATAVGNYAKVVNYNNPGIYIKNEYKMKKE